MANWWPLATQSFNHKKSFPQENWEKNIFHTFLNHLSLDLCKQLWPYLKAYALSLWSTTLFHSLTSYGEVWLGGKHTLKSTALVLGKLNLSTFAADNSPNPLKIPHTPSTLKLLKLPIEGILSLSKFSLFHQSQKCHALLLSQYKKYFVLCYYASGLHFDFKMENSSLRLQTSLYSTGTDFSPFNNICSVQDHAEHGVNWKMIKSLPI